MPLETYSNPEDIYLARGSDVPIARPVFTGDVFDDVPIPGVQNQGLAIVVAHPCSIRGANARLANKIPMASVRDHDLVPTERWSTGYYDRLPLPGLLQSDGFHVADFTLTAPVDGNSLLLPNRIACLSHFGVNMLQQRLIWHLTRFEVPTHTLHEAFSHTLEEADLLEEWTEYHLDRGISAEEAAATFEEFIRSPAEPPADSTLQNWLRDPQRRSTVRARMRSQFQQES